MAGLPKKYAKMGFKKGWAAYKKSKKPKTAKKKRPRAGRRMVKTVARRRRSSPKKRYSRKKYTTISVMTIGHMAMQYSNLTGQPLGTVVDALIGSLINGQGDVLEIIMAQVQSGLQNVVDNPAGVAIRGALIAFLFSQGKSIVGHKTIFKAGRFKVTV